MAEGGFPNRNRADNALTVYRDAMREYLAPILERKHGPDWIRSQVLNDELSTRNPGSYERRLQSLRSGTPARNLIDLADIPFLVRNNSDVFADLGTGDTQRMHQIRDLRNEIHHADRPGDCTVEETAALTGLCVLVLERCGLSGAADQIRRLPSASVAGSMVTSEAVSREQRERREWDKERLASKSPEELTQWEQQRLTEIEWEEEWEQRESVRREREEIAQLSGDIDALRHWFDADQARTQNHASDYAELQHQERLAQREREELAQLGDDIDALRRWFDAEVARRGRHPQAYAAVDPQEQARRELERRMQREREELARFGGDIDRLRLWFDADDERRERHPAEHEAMLKQELAWQDRLRRIAPSTMARLSAGRGRFFSPATRTSNSGHHSLAIREDGTMDSWGNNEYGQCDIGAPPWIQFIAVSAGAGHSLALRNDGTVICWGNNEYGQCNGPEGRFVAISAGSHHSLALREDGRVASWGQIDRHGFGEYDAPAGRFVAISAGGHQCAALRQDGTVETWGPDRFDENGLPPGPYMAVSVGSGYGVALREDGTVVCRGDNMYGRCNSPSGRYVAVSAGFGHSAALREDGKVVCWGDNRFGQCDAPRGRFVAVSAGRSETMALREDGTVVRWGLTTERSGARSWGADSTRGQQSDSEPNESTRGQQPDSEPNKSAKPSFLASALILGAGAYLAFIIAFAAFDSGTAPTAVWLCMLPLLFLAWHLGRRVTRRSRKGEEGSSGVVSFRWKAFGLLVGAFGPIVGVCVALGTGFALGAVIWLVMLPLLFLSGILGMSAGAHERGE